MIKKQILLLYCATILVNQPIFAGEIWDVTTSIHSTFLDYAHSNRVALYEIGTFISADYLDEGGVTVGYTYSELTFNRRPIRPRLDQFRGNLHRLDQTDYFLSVRKHLDFDGIPGKFTLRADGHFLDNDDASNNTDDVSVWATQASFLSYSKQYYVDFGYARSHYQNNLHVDQYTPTLGFALFDSDAWLQLRGYFIEPSNPDRAQGSSSTQAAEIKYTHWLTPASYFKPRNLQLGGMAGRRFYMVDMDAEYVANLADVQTGGIMAGAEWRLGEYGKMLLLGGENFYKNRVTNESYQGVFGYLNASITW